MLHTGADSATRSLCIVRDCGAAFDRILEDRYEPLGAPQGVSRRILAGLDAGLALTARLRPQTIEDWRLILGDVTKDTIETVGAFGAAAGLSVTKAPLPDDHKVQAATMRLARALYEYSARIDPSEDAPPWDGSNPVERLAYRSMIREILRYPFDLLTCLKAADYEWW
jgi:hypothetical protein